VPTINIPSTVVGQLTSLNDAFSTPDWDPVGTLVYFSGATEARAADNGSLATAPARGVIIAKTAVSVATILYVGEVGGFAGLVPGDDVFLGASGGIVQAAGLPTTPGTIIQKVGSALAADRILFFPSQLVVL
jgi:hypothetical protein